ncbi:MAG: NAD(P)H-hydrate dehydratase [Bacteroidetes bacterium]|nr:NAD(P)H-hydrate dehydratase [Bacteroidota bacterium]
MKIFSAAQIRACDAYTIHATPIASIDLMERAAGKCVEWISGQYGRDSLFVVLCGTGNNGGDGLAITRMLHQLGYAAKAFLLQFNPELSADCATNLQRLQGINEELVETLLPDMFITDIPENIIVIDAILGTGLNRAVQDWVAHFIEHINQLPNRKIAIDIPSGMPADTIPDEGAAIIMADETLSFQFYKRAFLHPETGQYAGNVHILDILLDKTFINSTHTNYIATDKARIKSLYKKRKQFSHKGTYGLAILIGGSYGSIGAICLATRAAARAGAGKTKALLPEVGYSIIQTQVPEAMCMTNGRKHLTEIGGWQTADAIGIGPGLGTEWETMRSFEQFLDECKQPIVVDADALNMIGKKPELLSKIPPGSVLTPHPKEFERIFGKTVNSMQQLEVARMQAMRYNLYIVLKNRYTAIVTPEGECRYNLTGNAGLATAGSGDVLTGIVTGLLAQGYDPGDAATMGVYLHGLAGDYAAEARSQEAMIAGDIVEHLGTAFQELL